MYTRKKRDDGGRDWVDASLSQGTLKIASKLLEARRVMEQILSHSPQKEPSQPAL